MKTPRLSPDNAMLERLSGELEQTRVALEDAHTDIAQLVHERDEALDAVMHQRAVIASAERKAAELRRELAATLASAMSRRGVSAASDDEELRVMLEESTVLAEELQAANEALLQTNRDLDMRVAERTEQLDRAMVELERMNAELSRRVEHETSERMAAQAELFQLQKMETIGELTGGIAHDFNNLLTVVISGMQVLSQVREPERRARLLRRMEEAAWRGADLTRRLLTFARRQPLQPDRVDLASHFGSFRDLLVHSLREDIAVETALAPELWPVEANIGALELALLNLTVNARDAMPRGGRLTIAAHNHTILPGRESVLGLEPGEYVALRVSDTGTGMTRDVQDRAFEPFFTTKDSGQGSGLGLAQVYGFARQSGGTTWLDSTPGEGTSVHVLLPRSRRSAAAPAPPVLRAARLERREQLSILVVEDDDDVAAAVLEMLAALGHSSTRVASVASALGALSGERQVHLVFSDVLLPGGGSGLDLAREMRRRHRAVPIILTSGYGGTVTDKLASAHLPFLRKPYQIDALRHAIEDAVSGPVA